MNATVQQIQDELAAVTTIQIEWRNLNSDGSGSSDCIVTGFGFGVRMLLRCFSPGLCSTRLDSTSGHEFFYREYDPVGKWPTNGPNGGGSFTN